MLFKFRVVLLNLSKIIYFTENTSFKFLRVLVKNTTSMLWIMAENGHKIIK